MKKPYIAALVACGKKKRSVVTKARDMYSGQLFVFARRICERIGCPWYILSAKHLLLDPSKWIAPYEATLSAMGKHERKTWARHVAKQVRATIPAGRLLILAGASYWKDLIEELLEYECETPLRGMGIGKQLHWMKERSG